MTNKKKRKAKSISAKTGMSHAAAMNQLNKTAASEPPTEHTRWRPTKPEAVADLDREIQEILGPSEKVHLQIEEYFETHPEENEPGPPADWIRGYGPSLDEALLGMYGEEYIKNRDDPKHPINKVDPRQHHKAVGPWDEKQGRLPLRPGGALRIKLCGLNPETYLGFNWIPLDQLKDEDFERFTGSLRSRIAVNEDTGEVTSLREYVVSHDIKSCQQVEDVCFKKLPVWVQLAEIIHRNLGNPQEEVPLVFSDRSPDSEGVLRYILQTAKAKELPHFRPRFEDPPAELQEVAFTSKIQKNQRRVFDVKTGVIHTGQGPTHIE